MNPHTIFIIDDNVDILELIRYNLEKEKYIVSTFQSGQEALSNIRLQTPNLIICDWMMEDLDGLELCKILKRDFSLSQIPFVMLTAKNEEIDAVVALEIGADEYLSKPIGMKELIARVKKILERSRLANQVIQQDDTGNKQGQISNLLVFKEISINIDNFKAVSDGQALDLTYSEFKLLQLLISKPGRVYTRMQIMEKLNGVDYFATERSIDVQVVGLRKKLGKYKDYLETVRGVGYRIIG